MLRLLNITILFLLFLVFIALFFPIAAAFQAHKLAGIVALFFFLLIFLIPLAYLQRYGYFRRSGK
ncbi:MAG: NADH-quinone oxidoreductase subunit A [Phycisphaerales bacterium]|nr:NADH-quinone oxidoreductase subunit A [Phycisphaerales bacterium]